MLYDLICLACERKEEDRWFPARLTPQTMPVCESCGHRLSIDETTTWARVNTFFSEKTPQVIHNLSPEPITVTSYAQHRDAMKSAGVSAAGRRYGEKGCWV